LSFVYFVSVPAWLTKNAPAPAKVFSAICVVFSHGAGEVGFMAGALPSDIQLHLCFAALLS
jgi:hypothetical protein